MASNPREADVPEWRMTAKAAKEMRRACDVSLEKRGQSKAFWIRGRSVKKSDS